LKKKEEKAMNEEVKPKEGEEEKVELDAETYQALLDKLGDLEEKVKGKEVEEEDEVTRLAREAEEKKVGEVKSLDYDSLTNKQLVEALETGINESVVVPLLTKISELEIKAEITELISYEDGEGKKPYEDFWDYRKEIYAIAKDNPNLDLERCYKLAKEQVGDKGETTTKEKGSGEDRLRHLPPVRRKGAPTGERPGVSISATSEEEPKTRREAAEKAYEEVLGEK
jgi:hypothetical protein